MEEEIFDATFMNGSPFLPTRGLHPARVCHLKFDCPALPDIDSALLAKHLERLLSEVFGASGMRLFVAAVLFPRIGKAAVEASPVLHWSYKVF